MNKVMPYPPHASYRDRSFNLTLRNPKPLVNDIVIEKTIFCRDVSIVIPVKNNQKGVDSFLESVAANMNSDSYPKDVIIVDNNSDVPLEVKQEFPFGVSVTRCTRRGPGAARNQGVTLAKGNWILFTDSDCIATPSLVLGYECDHNDSVAYAGMVQIDGEDVFADFYREQNTFYPMPLITGEGHVPSTLVTANCLVLKSAFTAIGGFDEKFIYAGGEDTDLGYRLRMIGKLKYNQHSIARHDISDGQAGFLNRFMRYGRGSRLLSQTYHETSIFEPSPLGFINNPNEANKLLAEMHFCAMSWGYRAEITPGF